MAASLQAQSQYRIRVHTRPAHLDLRQYASVLVTLQDAARRCAMAAGHPGPTLTPAALVSSISLFDGLPITEFDVLPISASRLL
jgi:hypothetical protein